MTRLTGTYLGNQADANAILIAELNTIITTLQVDVPAGALIDTELEAIYRKHPWLTQKALRAFNCLHMWRCLPTHRSVLTWQARRMLRGPLKRLLCTGEGITPENLADFQRIFYRQLCGFLCAFEQAVHSNTDLDGLREYHKSPPPAYPLPPLSWRRQIKLVPPGATAMPISHERILKLVALRQ